MKTPRTYTYILMLWYYYYYMDPISKAMGLRNEFAMGE